MTCLVSFGPIFIVSTQPVTYWIARTHKYSKFLVNIKKDKKKRLTKQGPERRIWHHLGPFSLSLHGPCPMHCIGIHRYSRTLVSFKNNVEKRDKAHLGTAWYSSHVQDTQMIKHNFYFNDHLEGKYHLNWHRLAPWGEFVWTSTWSCRVVASREYYG